MLYLMGAAQLLNLRLKRVKQAKAPRMEVGREAKEKEAKQKKVVKERKAKDLKAKYLKVRRDLNLKETKESR